MARLTNETPVTPALVKDHGLTEDEFAKIKQLIGREPNFTELGLFSAAWNEHCSYKSSRIWLKTLPTTGPHVIQGPGENAGVIDIGDGLAAVFKMESHNHPSYIEPFQGAATGVGGILRDVFTMGARPVALLNGLRFGSPDHPKTRHLVAGTVAGIGAYGNCMGVPTVGGEVNFHPAYDGNCLVNAMTVGIARTDKIFYSAAAGVGLSVVYVGSKTGRDGIHGATMASAGFDEATEEKRPTVQVGDPFTEKLLLEACLELMQSDAILAIQDMGAAGLTSSSVEMAAKGGVGIELNLDKVPQRETGMTPYEMMLSESQERMLMVLKTGREAEAEAIFKKWDLDFAVIGQTTHSGRLVLKWHGAVEADLPVSALADEAPVYDRPWVPAPKKPMLAASDVPAQENYGETLAKLMGSPDLCSRRWVIEQYDHMVMGDTLGRPGGDAAVIRVHGTGKALAITADVTPRYCKADPVEGGKQAIAEAWRNLTATGARPLAVTDCLNFGNPQVPHVMGELVGCIQGLGEAARALAFPVVSGNVSLYNATGDEGILPTPAIGGVGVIDDLTKRATIALTQDGDRLILIGKTAGHLGQSLYLRDICGREEGAPPPVDLNAEKAAGDVVRELIAAGTVTTVHDLSDGGLFVALGEMALAGGRGAALAVPAGAPPLHAFLFGEDQGRYLLAVPPAKAAAVMAAAQKAGVPAADLGQTGGAGLTVDGGHALSLEALRQAHEGWLPAYMSGKA